MGGALSSEKAPPEACFLTARKMQVEGCAQAAPAPGSLSCFMVVAIVRVPISAQSFAQESLKENALSGAIPLISFFLRLTTLTGICVEAPQIRAWLGVPRAIMKMVLSLARGARWDTSGWTGSPAVKAAAETLGGRAQKWWKRAPRSRYCRAAASAGRAFTTTLGHVRHAQTRALSVRIAHQPAVSSAAPARSWSR